MTVPIAVPISAGAQITSFDASDIVTGKVYKRYYACRGTTSDFLTTLQVDTNTFRTGGAIDAGGSFLAIGSEINFDLLFEKTWIVEGKMIVNAPVFIDAFGGGGGDSRLVVYIYHVSSGGTETQIGTVTTGTHNAAGGVDKSKMFCMDMAIARKKFKRNEKLRFALNLEGKGGSGASEAYVYHDPNSKGSLANDSDANAVETIITLDIPFINAA